MTPFDVDWIPQALNDLADIWSRASDRNAVTVAAAVIERLLKRDPVHNGHYLSENLYRLDEPPLAVYYTIDAARRSVEVSKVVFRP